MNLLPFVVIILVLLSLFSVSQLQSKIVEKKELQLYTTYFITMRESRNSKEKRVCTGAKAKEKKSHGEKQSEAQTSTQSSEPQGYFREKRVGWERGKLNLSSLINDSGKWPVLELVTAAYIKELYSGASFYPKEKDFEKKFLRTLIATLKESKDRPPLHELQFKDQAMQAIFYRMLRGTNTYVLNPKKGIPPFGDFFTFEPSEKPPMNLHYANLSFLSALVGHKGAQKLKTSEEECFKNNPEKKRYQCPYSFEELRQLLDDPKLTDLSERLSLLDQKYKAMTKPPGMARDQQTQITVLTP